jgi:hypothetical protein
MNGNELANLLEVDSWYKLVTREEIATTLRQQQTEIEALKEKTLTDEEIVELSEQWLDMSWQTGVIDFARAILRKAQEK